MLKKELTPLHLSDVTIDGPFWAQRIKINRERTIPRLYKIFGEKGQIDALKPGWEPPKVLLLRFFGYGGIYKWIEAVSYSITTHPDAKLESVIDDLVEQIAKRQQPDGYTPGSYRNTEPEKRFRMSLQSLGGGLSGGVLDSGDSTFPGDR